MRVSKTPRASARRTTLRISGAVRIEIGTGWCGYGFLSACFALLDAVCFETFLADIFFAVLFVASYRFTAFFFPGSFAFSFRSESVGTSHHESACCR